MLEPKFPYRGNQIIISSGRVTAHSKDDAVFIFGQKGVGISTPATFNVDAPERTIINSNIIELGLNAKDQGQPILKGTITIQQLGTFFDAIKSVADTVRDIANASGADTAWCTLSTAIDNLSGTASTVNGVLQTKAKSTAVFTI